MASGGFFLAIFVFPAFFAKGQPEFSDNKLLGLVLLSLSTNESPLGNSLFQLVP